MTKIHCWDMQIHCKGKGLRKINKKVLFLRTVRREKKIKIRLELKKWKNFGGGESIIVKKKTISVL